MLSNDGFQLGVKFLSLVGREEEEEVNSNDHGVILGLMGNKCVFVEEFNTIDGVFDGNVIPGGQSVQQVQLGIPY